MDYNVYIMIQCNDGSYCSFPLFAPLTYYTPSIKNVGMAQWQVQVATSAVWPKGQVPARKTISDPIHSPTKGTS